MVSGDECPGRFEREFDVLDEDLGSGEFGRVLKVQRKADDGFGSMSAKDDKTYAIKKSKPIEGMKHRCVVLFIYRCDYDRLRMSLLSDCVCERKSTFLSSSLKRQQGDVAIQTC